MRLEIVKVLVQNRRGVSSYTAEEIACMQASVEMLHGFRMYTPSLPQDERRVMFSPPIDGYAAGQLMSTLVNAGFGDCESIEVEIPSSKKD